MMRNKSASAVDPCLRGGFNKNLCGFEVLEILSELFIAPFQFSS